ncbi:MAG TPA: hypothetical protein EYO33_30935 [Phycisphaerales bacterium]|nr:hypothetical protein [Phycisphaerales bacterium]
MARRKKAKRRSKPAFSILNAIEALAYGSLLTEGIAGTSITGFIFGDKDLKSIGTSYYDAGLNGYSTATRISGADQISLADIVSEPTLAISTMTDNFQKNIIPMALAAFGISITFRVGRRLLRRPLASVNKNLITPALGKGIRM